MSDEGEGNEEFAKLSLNLCTDGKKVENGTVVGEEREGGQQRGNKVGQDVKGSVQGALRVGGGCVNHNHPQQQQTQTSQGAGVCWERFLHVRSLRVLLVENDDCTRHVVAALLRNCSYEVIEASNGLQAWKILEDITNRIDLILTEVVMPCVSGIGLLYKIMSHKTWKNVPVIMMSSHDSMGLVFKCLSKGAVDFLVKPIRKNELKNLWQHVWRRCHSSSGSGSGTESGTQTQKSVKSKSVERSDNNSGSNDEEDNGSPTLNFGDGSDHGSGTQSSWTKQAADDQVQSPQMVSSRNEAPEGPDSTCAQVINHNAKSSGSKLFSVTATNECQEHRTPNENIVVEKTLEAVSPKKLDLQHNVVMEVPTELNCTNQYSAPKLDSSQYSERLDNKAREDNEVQASDLGNRFSKIPDDKDKVVDENKVLPSIEQGLKRLRGSQDLGKTVQDDRNVLRRSGSSAFSRYNAAQHNKVSSTDIQSLVPLDSGLNKKSEVRHHDQSRSGSNTPNQCSDGGNVYVDMASTSNNRLTEMIILNNKISETPNSHPSEFRATDGAATVQTIVPPESSIQELLQSGRNIQQLELPSNRETLRIRKMAESIPHCGSSTALGGHVEGNGGNCSVNGSVSGSNYGSNGPNRSSSGANVGVTNMESDNGAGGKSGSGDASGSQIGSGSGSGSGSGYGIGSGSGTGTNVDHNKQAQREAALIKFRQKRKERCFKRKVRYQSRKRLAEQRPRVRGQFVRQVPGDESRESAET